MQDQTKQIPGDHDCRVERAIVLQTLREDHDRHWSRDELTAELHHADPRTIDEALTRLKDEGVIELAGEIARASPATLCLDELGMIAV